MTERIRIEVDDAELEAVIARLDEAILKKAGLVTGVPTGVPGVPETGAVEDEVGATVDQLKSELIGVEDMAAAVEASVEMTVTRLTYEILAVEQTATAVDRKVAIQFLETELRMKTFMESLRDLPQVDRATRMILLRIPGLREVLRLMYIVRMGERTLRLGTTEAKAEAAKVGATAAKLMVELKAVKAEAIAVEMSTRASIARVTAEMQAAEAQAAAGIASIRGPVTAAVTLLLYAIIANQVLQQRQDKIEARMAALEREMKPRMISLEEAVRGYGALPERYRSTIIP